ncbi:IQ domain-containing protein M [Dipodomys spectabilis]|uniref:IQ domain-containing protein M n=1 Tax=Dipodomys spectabilis TaxID=105255 RepID=UPI001C536EEF|nr:IQ domain-containing protein M [Dipodomys spectabilis]
MEKHSVCEPSGLPGCRKDSVVMMSLFGELHFSFRSSEVKWKQRCDPYRSRTLQIPRQNFLYEAKFLIARHYMSLKENEVPGTSIDVFKNKYPKSHFVRYVPSKIKKTKTPDVVQEHKAVLRSICFPQILPPEGHFKKPSVFNIKERYPTVNLFTKDSRARSVDNGFTWNKDLFLPFLPPSDSVTVSPLPLLAAMVQGSQKVVAGKEWICIAFFPTISTPSRKRENRNIPADPEGFVCFNHAFYRSLTSFSINGKPIALFMAFSSCSPSLCYSGFHYMHEQVKLSKIITDIIPVSKKMEEEKQLYPGKPRALGSSHAIAAYPSVLLQRVTSTEGTQRETERVVYDWRGIMSARFFHLHEDQKLSESSEIFRDYCMRALRRKKLQPIKPEPKPDRYIVYMKAAKLDSKVKRIGPHLDIFQVFGGNNKQLITKKVVKMIVHTQATVRGWLERKRLERISTKALYHGRDLRSVMDMYRRLIYRVRHHLGLWKTRQVMNLTELEEWMDRKKFYETMFAKREDWKGLQKSELLKYFNECGHFPTQKQIDDYWERFHNYKPRKHSEIIQKSQVIEMLFTLYPPLGAHVHQNLQLKSTWLRPIVDGEEGYKYIVSGHPILKRANIRVVGKLVAKSIRERKLKQC